MKKTFKKIFIGCTLIAFTSGLYGCGDVKTIKGKTFDTYGALNASEMKNKDVEYRLIIGNVVWSVLLIETVVAPIYFLGFSLFEPVGVKGEVENGVIR